MHHELCNQCEYSESCRISHRESTEACKIACRWPNTCRCGETSGVKIVCLTTNTSVMTFPICKKCFCCSYSDLAEWDDVCLRNYSEEGKMIFLNAKTVVREYIKNENFDLTRRIMQKQIDTIKDAVKDTLYVASYEIRDVIKIMREERRIKVA